MLNLWGSAWSGLSGKEIDGTGPAATGSRGASGRDGDGEVTRDRLEPVQGECVQARRRRQATEQGWAEVEVAAA